MQNFLKLLIAYGVHFLFIILEIFCIYLIVNYNKPQKAIWLNSTNIFATKINNRVDKAVSYIKLEDVNDSLINENARLLQRFIKLDEKLLQSDSSLSAQYNLIPSTICNSTINLRNNYITLCKGHNSGIEKDMGVISVNGIVGIVKETSDNFALVIPILSGQSNISCSIKKVNAFGSLVWNGYYTKILNLEAIPRHVQIAVGDTIVTSGYSTVFPKNLPVGKISSFSVEEGSYEYNIEVELFNDPSALDVVYVINNTLAKEQKELEITD
jgi:rod shape-determining protein MreC